MAYRSVLNEQAQIYDWVDFCQISYRLLKAVAVKYHLFEKWENLQTHICLQITFTVSAREFKRFFLNFRTIYDRSYILKFNNWVRYISSLLYMDQHAFLD